MVEQWDYSDDRYLQSWKGQRICITCQHFTYGVDTSCRTILGCNLRRQQLQQAEHLLKRCHHWSTLVDKPIGMAEAEGL